mgnify:FL=1
MNSWNPDFSHLYIETGSEDTPLAKTVLERYPDAERIPVEDYRAIFNRPRQRFQQQKRSLKLILARKKDHLIYPGSDNAQNFDTPNFFYVTPFLNCLYNCDYCFLQGMYSSANLVLFTNQDAMVRALREVAAHPPEPHKPVFCAISYNTDLLAMEPWFGLSRFWIESTRDLANLRIEIRSKSGNFRSLRDLPASPHAILAWTLSPDAVFRQYEHGTAPPNLRIRAAAEAAQAGWPVRICIDPVLHIENWKEHYRGLIQNLFRSLPPERILDLSVGVFRMSAPYFKTIRSRQPASDLYYAPFETADGLVKYPDALQAEMMGTIYEWLSDYLPPERIGVWDSAD